MNKIQTVNIHLRCVTLTKTLLTIKTVTHTCINRFKQCNQTTFKININFK
jgi:hypothetical protein